MGNYSKRHWAVEYGFITIGVILFALAVVLFFAPNNLVTGGVSGLGIIFLNIAENHLGFTFQLWQSNFLLNVPLFIIGAKLKGMRFVQRSFFAMMLLTASLFAFEQLPLPDFTNGDGMDMILTALFGGVLGGLGIGIVLVNSSTTGGSDLLATIIKHKKKHIEVSKILFVLDAAVIAIGLFTFGPINTMYAIIAVFVAAKVITAIEEGLSFSRAAFIISDKSEEIAARLLAELNRGTTALTGKGMYTKTEKNVLLCVVSKKEIVELKEIAGKTDPTAFVIVTDAREVLGLGFQRI